MASLALALAVLANANSDSKVVGFGPNHQAITKTCNRRPLPRPPNLVHASGGGATSSESANGDMGNLSKEERRQQSRNWNDARATCPQCQRPPSSCVCAALPSKGKITLPHVDILILQHPSEFRRKHVSTVPLIPLVLDNVKISVRRAFDDTFMQHVLGDVEARGKTPLLLFPGADAITLDQPRALEELQSRSEQLRQHSVIGDESETDAGNNLGASMPVDLPRDFFLILIDGTWTQAGSMVRNSSPLLLEKCLPIQFLSTAKSQQSMYHSMRKQPNAHCLSTLEACARTLPLLEKLAAESFKDRVENSRVEELETSGVTLADDAVHHLHEALEILVQTQLEYEKESILSNRAKVRDPRKLQEKWMRGA